MNAVGAGCHSAAAGPIAQGFSMKHGKLAGSSVTAGGTQGWVGAGVGWVGVWRDIYILTSLLPLVSPATLLLRLCARHACHRALAAWACHAVPPSTFRRLHPSL